jgi:hypothetical protein
MNCVSQSKKYRQPSDGMECGWSMGSEFWNVGGEEWGGVELGGGVEKDGTREVGRQVETGAWSQEDRGVVYGVWRVQRMKCGEQITKKGK